jgi:hypothetical protein
MTTLSILYHVYESTESSFYVRNTQLSPANFASVSVGTNFLCVIHILATSEQVRYSPTYMYQLKLFQLFRIFIELFHDTVSTYETV